MTDNEIMLVGKNGQVGWELQRTLASLGRVAAFDRTMLDLTDIAAVRAAVRRLHPRLIVNAAAYTAVDAAETAQTQAQGLNADIPGVLAEEAKRLGAVFIHYSTDYVFDGVKSSPYTEEDTPRPLNVYGLTKRAGEEAVQAVGGAYLIFRTSWVYGRRGKNFLRTLWRLAAEKDTLSIVDDQIGAPTWSRMIAEATALVLAQCGEGLGAAAGIYHLACAGGASWHGFAQAVFAHRGTPRQPLLRPIPSRDYPLPARRPGNSLLSSEKLQRQFGIALPDWRQALALCLAEDEENV